MEGLKNNRGIIIAEGILFILLGFFAIAMPAVSTLSTELFIGWILIFGGIFQAYRTFKSQRSASFWSSFFLSLMYVVFGVLLIAFPLVGMVSLTMLLIVFFGIEGVTKIILGYQLKNYPRWGFIVFSGVLALIMAVIILAGLPGTAFWAIGLLVGINLVFFGASLLFLGTNTTSQIPPSPPVV